MPFLAIFIGLEVLLFVQFAYSQVLAGAFKTRLFPTKWSRESKNLLLARAFVEIIPSCLLNNPKNSLDYNHRLLLFSRGSSIPFAEQSVMGICK